MAAPQNIFPPSFWPRLLARWRVAWLLGCLGLYGGLAVYHLGLPGLHYDEAREAGLNAVQLLNDVPVTAFREATLSLFGRAWPLMVQDYIGALNVYLSLPFLTLTGIGVPNLRVLPVLTGAVTLLLLERATSEWMSMQATGCRTSLPAAPSLPTPISLAGLLAVTFLAASPSFVFWSRQGIFVTNVTQPLTLWCVWQGLRWVRSSRETALLWSAFAAGLALYAKLLAIWIVAPFVFLMGGWWLWRVLKPGAGPISSVPRISLGLAGKTALIFTLPLLPLLIFNWKTGGTAVSILENWRESYYGADNTQVWMNLAVRWGQLLQSLRGDHFWYLGGIFGNDLAPWLAGLTLALGLGGSRERQRWAIGPPISLLALATVCSVFTVSGHFITHYALVQPWAVATVGIAGECACTGLWPRAPGFARHLRHWLTALIVFLWLILDLTASIRYHKALAQSGGLSDHSDATYHLVYYLQYNGLGAPVTLDWGMDATIRFLSNGTVNPIEIFGYSSVTTPDDDFIRRLEPFLANPDNVYLLRSPGQTVFQGWREVFFERVRALGHTTEMETVFRQRDGVALFEVWRVN